MIPPRGCAYICMVHRQDAYRALQKLSTGSYKIGSKVIKVCVKNVRWLIFALFYNFFWEYVLNVALLADRLGPQQRGETGVQAILGCGPWGHVYSVGEGQTGWPGWFCRGRHDWPGDRQQRWEEFPCLGAENCILCNLYICSYTRHLTLFFSLCRMGIPEEYWDGQRDSESGCYSWNQYNQQHTKWGLHTACHDDAHAGMMLALIQTWKCPDKWNNTCLGYIWLNC